MIGVVLAGGASSRMGHDKAALSYKGFSLLERQVQLLQEAGLSRVIVSGRSQPDDWTLDASFCPDEQPGAGPLAGLQAVLRAEQETVLLIACDMPALSCEAICWLKQQSAGHSIISESSRGIEPLFSCYAASVLPAIDELLIAGRRSVHGLIRSASLPQCLLPAQYDEHVQNINTQDEWQRFLADGKQAPRSLQ